MLEDITLLMCESLLCDLDAVAHVRLGFGTPECFTEVAVHKDYCEKHIALAIERFPVVLRDELGNCPDKCNEEINVS